MISVQFSIYKWFTTEIGLASYENSEKNRYCIITMPYCNKFTTFFRNLTSVMTALPSTFFLTPNISRIASSSESNPFGSEKNVLRLMLIRNWKNVPSSIETGVEEQIESAKKRWITQNQQLEWSPSGVLCIGTQLHTKFTRNSSINQ